MQINAYQYYPTGYRRPLDESQSKGDILPDAELVSLWQALCKDRSLFDSFEYKDRVIQCVKRLFGDFAEWLDAQDKNVKITDHGYQFIIDTIGYIDTGHRDVMIITRSNIIAQQYYAGVYEDKAVAARKTRLRDLLRTRPSEFVYQWLQHRDGFEDMLCTSVFLFGTELRK